MTSDLLMCGDGGRSLSEMGATRVAGERCRYPRVSRVAGLWRSAIGELVRKRMAIKHQRRGAWLVWLDGRWTALGKRVGGGGSPTLASRYGQRWPRAKVQPIGYQWRHGVFVPEGHGPVPCGIASLARSAQSARRRTTVGNMSGLRNATWSVTGSTTVLAARIRRTNRIKALWRHISNKIHDGEQPVRTRRI